MVSIKYSREGIPLCTQCEAELNAEDVQLGAVCFKCKREIIERYKKGDSHAHIARKTGDAQSGKGSEGS